MDRLLKLGFIKVGFWDLDKKNNTFQLLSHQDSTKLLYCFIANKEIKYIGKTTTTLFNRLRGYQRPGSSQRTNLRVNKKINSLLQKGECVDIYVLPDSGLLKYGDFQLSIAAGLEDILISELKPEWNITGKSDNFDHIKTHEKSIRISELADAEARDKFELTLWSAYYNNGFFNVRKSYSDKFGKDRESITIQLGSSPEDMITGIINRTANNNDTPRILGHKPLKSWIQNNFNLNDVIIVDIVSPTFIRLKGSS